MLKRGSFPVSLKLLCACSGANGLAAPRDFQTPVAWFEERACAYTIYQKLGGQMFQARDLLTPPLASICQSGPEEPIMNTTGRHAGQCADNMASP